METTGATRSAPEVLDPVIRGVVAPDGRSLG